MPFSVNRAFLGVGKANAATYLTSAVAAAATSIPVNGTVVPASSTIYFIDGALSEKATVSAGGGSSTLTVGAITNAHPVGTPIYYQLTASLGPTDYIPLTAFPDAADTIATVADTGIRGSNVAEYGVQTTIGASDISLQGDFFADTTPWLLGSIYGAVDFAGGSPNQHTFAGMNTSASNGQPTELMLWVYNGNNTRLYVGCKASDFVLTYDPAQLLKWTSKLKGFLSGVTTTPTPSFGALTTQQAWQATTTIGGVVVPNLMTATITIARASVDAIPSLDGNQSPYKIWSGPLNTTGVLNTIMEDDSMILNYVQNSQPATVITLVNGTGASQVGITIQMTRTNFLSGWKATGGTPYVEVGGPISAVSSTTDANTAGGGYSPSRVTVKNAIATGHYQ